MFNNAHYYIPYDPFLTRYKKVPNQCKLQKEECDRAQRKSLFKKGFILDGCTSTELMTLFPISIIPFSNNLK